MSDVIVRVPAVLRPFAGGVDELHVAAGTLAHVLEQLPCPPPAIVPRGAGFGLRQLDVLGRREHRQEEEPLEDKTNLAKPQQTASGV